MEQSSIEDHKNMLIFSKKISDFQITNLQKYAFMAFPEIKTLKLGYDFLDESGLICAGRVEYDMIFKEGTKITKKEREKRFSNLEKWVKTLLFQETELALYKDGKEWN